MKKIAFVLLLAAGSVHAQQTCNPDEASGRILAITELDDASRGAMRDRAAILTGQLMKKLADVTKERDEALEKLKNQQPEKK